MQAGQRDMEGLPSRGEKWYKVIGMVEPDDLDPQKPHEEEVPIGIARLRREWRAAGLADRDIRDETEQVEPVLFPEVDGGAGVGDYTLDCDDRSRQPDALPGSDGPADRRG